jgi:putative ABC transport system substrate-binding protein
MLCAIAAGVPAQERARVGFLTSTQLTDEIKEAFTMGLAEHGYRGAKELEVLWRTADGKPELAKRHADELVASRVRLLVTVLTPAARAAKDATRNIPIVMAYAGDPVATGLVASLARPGGNITGLSGNAVEISGKRIELLQEIVPGITSLGLMILGTDPFARPFVSEMEPAARKLGVKLHIVDVRSPEQVDAAFGQLKKRGAQAVVVQGALTARSWRAAELALRYKLPSVSPQRRFADDGGMMYHGANLAAAVRRSAWYVDRILRGAKPADLPIEQPTKFELVINVRTARALGVAVPPGLRVRADHIIE